MARPKTHPLFLEPRKGTLKVSKEDAAARQVETALKLWFEGGDPVAVCTLAHAGWVIIKKLNKKRNATSSMSFENMELPGISPEDRERLYFQMFSSGANFFKHAGPDDETVIYYDPLITILLLYESISIYRKWKLPKRPAFEVFLLWLIECDAKMGPQETFDAESRLLTLKVFSNPKKVAFYRSRMLIARRLFVKPASRGFVGFLKHLVSPVSN